jgi:hypothetical protein
MKIKKETLVKLIAATIVPGGFIIWGLHELAKLRKGDKRVQRDSDPPKN